MPYKEKKYYAIGKYERELNRLTVPQVIEELKFHKIYINKQTLYNYENGTSDMPMSVLIALAEIYHCTLAELLQVYIPTSKKEKSEYYELNGYNELLNTYPIDRLEDTFDLKKNIFHSKYIMTHVILFVDDVDTGLPKFTRIIYRKTGGFKFNLTTDYNYYFISIPDIVDGIVTTRKHFTKAKVIENSVTPRIVQYFYKGQVAHIAEQYFKEMVEGIVVKVIYDRQMKKTEGAFFY